MIPKATIVSGWATMSRFLGTLKRAAAIGLGSTVLLAGAAALSQAGCRNDAITYAHAVWPEAKCSAIETKVIAPGPDIAICHVGDRTLMCKSSREIDAVPSCEDIKP